jgi:hypothetical protein
MSEKYDYTYEERRRIIKQINDCRAHKQSKIVPNLDDMVSDVFDDVADLSNKDWFTKPSITLTPEQAVHIGSYLYRFQDSAEKLIFFLDFIEEKGQISLWEEYQQEVDRRGSFGSTGAKTPDALKKV